MLFIRVTCVHPETFFLEFMHLATEGVEFSFDEIMYSQIDGVSMDSTLALFLANIFVGYYEILVFEKKLYTLRSPGVMLMIHSPSLNL